MKYPNFREERKLWKKGYKMVVGLDEAGRGPLAGPVTAAAVTVRQFQIPKELKRIRDSKKLTLKKREEIYQIITNHSQIDWGIGRVSEKVIDKINILEATKLAMKRAVKNLEKKNSAIDFLIIDGNFTINTLHKQKAMIKADEKVFSCVAASIIAKVTRDRIMKRYHKKFPQYGFNLHKGYPTRLHRTMLKKYSPCKIHRKSFKPVRLLS